MDLDLIVNRKVTDDGESIIQVRSAHNRDAARKLSQAYMTNPAGNGCRRGNKAFQESSCDQCSPLSLPPRKVLFGPASD